VRRRGACRRAWREDAPGLAVVEAAAIGDRAHGARAIGRIQEQFLTLAKVHAAQVQARVERANAFDRAAPHATARNADPLTVIQRHGDFALVAAAAQIAVDDNGKCTRVSFGLAGGGYIPMAFPQLAARLVGSKLEDELLQSVVTDAAGAFDPGGDLHASPEYRRQLATVLAARMLRAAYDGARKAS
jgi:xanthine dehydrogenase iron-sulfur cluster and FAD-binding subunit A